MTNFHRVEVATARSVCEDLNGVWPVEKKKPMKKGMQNINDDSFWNI